MRNGQGDIIGLFDGNGTIVARYSYDSWGNLLSIKDGNGNDKTNDTAFVGYKNPLRYRGYYYDSETKLYYLQSRYYNPEWGRFINADSIIGANGDLTSNNPVMRMDPSGEFWGAVAIIAVVGFVAASSAGCSAQNHLRSAPKLDRSTASSKTYNCYGNAISKQVRANPSGYKTGDSTAKTFEGVKADVGANNIRQLNSINDQIYENENLVALKCGPMDYHFMVRVDGVWYNKPGTPPLIVNESIDIVTSQIWKGRYLNNYGQLQSNSQIFYDDETIYFAIAKEWDTN